MCLKYLSECELIPAIIIIAGQNGVLSVFVLFVCSEEQHFGSGLIVLTCLFSSPFFKVCLLMSTGLFWIGSKTLHL